MSCYVGSDDNYGTRWARASLIALLSRWIRRLAAGSARSHDWTSWTNTFLSEFQSLFSFMNSGPSSNIERARTRKEIWWWWLFLINYLLRNQNQNMWYPSCVFMMLLKVIASHIFAISERVLHAKTLVYELDGWIEGELDLHFISFGRIITEIGYWRKGGSCQVLRPLFSTSDGI